MARPTCPPVRQGAGEAGTLPLGHPQADPPEGDALPGADQ